jgi:hypothetical protein
LCEIRAEAALHMAGSSLQSSPAECATKIERM